jgi:hypothetical protein
MVRWICKGGRKMGPGPCAQKEAERGLVVREPTAAILLVGPLSILRN